ncbi:MAG: NAD-dependent epimerase/dehydratase family protein [Bacteroidetes bacterium]|nr:NAD-dependent epimerase/dehydratase family protein [Bacteroidota bacterium]
MKILVTGATGFIGARLVRELLRKGQEISILCRATSDVSAFENTPVRIFRGDLASPDDMRAAIADCDAVYHLAAFAKNWARYPEEVHRINRDALENVLAVAREIGVRRVLYTSTVMVYGPSNGHPVTERTQRSAPCGTLYEESKIQGEAIVDRAVADGLDVVVVHPSRVFGPGLLSEANSTTILMQQYLRGTYRMLPGDGSAAGNYVFVDDVVRGCIAAMDHGRTGRHYILGGANLTFSEFFDILAECSGKRRRLMPVPRVLARGAAIVQEKLGSLGVMTPVITPGWVDVFYDDWLCSSAQAETEIGYEPTAMKDAVQITVDWLRNENGRKEVLS